MKRYCFLGLFTFLLPVILVANDAKKDRSLANYIRVSKPEGKRAPVSYDTAIAQFADAKNNVQVDLIGAIHIGDKEYYLELNEIFKRYDAVLYELVAEENAKPSSGGKNESQSVLSSFQAWLGSALALDFQLAHIDYHAKNMIHADLNPSEFAQRFQDRGDHLQMLFRLMELNAKKSRDETAQEDELNMVGRFLGSLIGTDPALSLKRTLAEKMTNQLDDGIWVIGGDGSAIITDRNEAALNVLRREINNGKKKIAIFYGAAHLPEFAKSLEKDFGMKPTGTNWVVAWDLTTNKSARK
jgi:hypothetical protein